MAFATICQVVTSPAIERSSFAHHHPPERPSSRPPPAGFPRPPCWQRPPARSTPPLPTLPLQIPRHPLPVFTFSSRAAPPSHPHPTFQNDGGFSVNYLPVSVSHRRRIQPLSTFYLEVFGHIPHAENPSLSTLPILPVPLRGPSPLRRFAFNSRVDHRLCTHPHFHPKTSLLFGFRKFPKPQPPIPPPLIAS
jgi:hypothetical protein